MKKYLIGFCFLALAAASCRKVDDSSVFEKTADQRLTEALANYQTKLTSEANGWKALLYTKGGGIYSLYFKFNDSNRVKMLSSFDSTSAVTLKESSYRLKALQQPSLLFDTYSYIHVISDPNPAVNGGVLGTGLQSDFEFYFEDEKSNADSITLIGRFNESRMVMRRATATEAADYARGRLVAGLEINKILTYFKRIVINGIDSVDVHSETLGSEITAIDANGNLLDETRKTSYYLTLGGLSFSKPLTVGTKSVSEITNISYNPTTGIVTATIGGAPAVIKPVIVPAKVDVNAPRRWWQYAITNGNGYWATTSGFRINGVDDALGLKNIPGYNGFTIFWPRYGTSGGVNYDLLSPITNGAVQFGAAYRPPTFTADGRVVFPFFGTLGTVPAAGNTIYTSLRIKMAEAAGYYLVQIDKDGLVYDMVSATDGKSWVRWEW